MSRAASSKSGFYYGYVIVAASLLIMVMIWGTWSTFGIFFESLLVEFGWTRAVTSGAQAIGNIVFGLLCIVSTRFSDMFGIRKLATACSFFLGLGYFLMSQINTIWHVYLFIGVFIPLGMSSYIAVVSTVAKWFDRRRGMMTGIIFTGLGLGTMIFPPLARWIISNYEWRSAYIIICISALVVTVLAAQFLRDAPGSADHQVNGGNDREEKGTILEQGISARQAMFTGQFWMICILYVVFLACINTVMVHVFIHAIGLAITAVSAANILAIAGGLSIVGNNVMGTASDKIGNKSALTVSFALMALSLFWILTAREVWMFYLFAAIFGFSFGGMQVLFSPIVAELFGLGAHGVILAIANFVGTIGGAGGPVVAGYIFDTINSYNLAFIICAVMATMGAVLAILLRPVVVREITE